MAEWDLPVLKWGKDQGGIVGFSHSGTGLQVPGTKLPSYDMPAFDGIGANEYIVDVANNVCDFISAVDTPIIWELSIWYHTLNCGYQCRISGETDFPCIYGERVGLGRAYVKLSGKENQPLDYDQWAVGIRDGRSYCSEGLAHLIDFSVDGLGVGEAGADGRASVLAAKSGQKLPIRVRAAAMLEEKPREDIRRKRLDQKPYWHVERARVGDSRKVPVELIVNGQSVETREIEADGRITDVQFDFVPRFPAGLRCESLPARTRTPCSSKSTASQSAPARASAQWCLEAVDVCWNKKLRGIRENEQAAAAAAYDVARQAYRKALAEAQAE